MPPRNKGRRRDDHFQPVSGGGARPAPDAPALVPASTNLDPYSKYGLPPHVSERNTQKTSFPGYLSSEASAVTTYHPRSSIDVGRSSGFRDRNSRSGAYGIEADHGGITSGSSIRGIDNGRGFHPEVDHGRLTSGTSIRGIDDAGGYHPEADHGRVTSGTNTKGGRDDDMAFHPEADCGELIRGSSIRGIDDARGFCPEADHHRVTRKNSISGLDDGRGFLSEADHGGLTSRTSRGLDDARNYHPEADRGRLTSGTGGKGYPSPLRDSILQGKRTDIGSYAGIGLHETNFERPNSLRRLDGHPIPTRDSNILLVDGLPTDCTRREVGHLFRPFIGFREIRVIHKEPRRTGDKPMVFCFVEFADSKCAFTAMEALQGYLFDDKKSDASVLKIHYVHFPFRPPSDEEVQPFGGLR